MKRWLLTGLGLLCLAGVMANCSSTPAIVVKSQTESVLPAQAGQANLVFVGKIIKVGDAPGFWSGYIAVGQEITYQVLELLKPSKSLDVNSEIRITYTIVMGNPLCDPNKARLAPEIFSLGNKVIVLASDNGRQHYSPVDGKSVLLYSDALKSQVLKLMASRTAPDLKWAGWGDPKNGLRCLVTVNQDSSIAGEPIMVRCKVANISDKTQFLSSHPGYTKDLGTYASLVFSLIDQSGQEVQVSWPRVKDNETHPIELKPGEIIDLFTADIMMGYKTIAPGEYVLQIACIYDWFKTEASVQVASNPLKIRVVKK